VDQSSQLSRRRVLQTFGLAVGGIGATALLAACGAAASVTATTSAAATGVGAATTSAAATSATATTSAAAPAPAANAQGATGNLNWDTFRGVGTPWPDQRIKAFQDANSGWKVTLRPIPLANGNQMDAYPKMYAMYAGGTLGDVFAFDPSHWEFYRAVPKGLMRPLDDLIARDHFDLTQFYAPFMDMQKLNGKTWGLPSWGWSGQDGFIYNQVIFQKEGIAEPDQNSPAWTMDAVRQLAKKLTKMGSNGAYDRYGMNLALGAPGASVYTRAYNQADFYDPKKSLIADPQVMPAFQWVQDMAQIDKSIALPGGFQGANTDLFASGKLAIIQSGSLTAFNANKAIKDPKAVVVRSALFPKRSDGKRPSQMRGGTWNVGSKSKNQDAAWKFIQLLDNKEGTLTFNTIGGNGALVRPDVMSDPYFSLPGFVPFKETC
jgi:multiple sugar transport system substrate-binding protein